MGKPWEEKSAGPWNSPDDDVPVDGGAINEQHPGISFMTRTMLQNLGNSPEAKAAYLKNQGFETEVSGGEVLVKKPGERTWQKLAYKGPEAKDITDNIYNVGAGIGQGVAATAAGLAAAPATGGVASLPAAMATSGVTGAGLEALRQKLGQYYGIPQEVDIGDVGIQGAVGAVAPAVFGAGITAKQLAGKGLSGEALKRAGTNSRSLVTRGLEKITPSIGEMFTGVPKEATRKLIEDPDVLKRLANGGANDLAEAAHRQVTEGTAAARQQIGGDMQRLYESSGASVETSPIKGAFQERLNYLRSKPDITNAEQAEIQSLQAAYEKYFNLASPKEVLNKTPEMLAEEARVFSQLDQVNKIDPIAPQLPENLADAVEPRYPARVDKAFDLKPESDYTQDLASYYKGAPASENLRGATREANQTLADIVRSQKEERQSSLLARLKEINTPEIRTEIEDQIPVSRAFDLQQKLRQAAAWQKDMTPENMSVAGSARKSWDAINEGLDTATEAASGDLKSQYANLKSIEPKIDKYFADPEKTYNTLTNYSGESKKWLRNTMKDFDGATKGATNLDDLSAQLQAYRHFENPSWTPISSGGTTSTSRTMNTAALASSAGYKMGGPPGQITAHALAYFLGGPKAMKAAIRSSQAVGKAAPIANPAALSIWSSMLRD